MSSGGSVEAIERKVFVCSSEIAEAIILYCVGYEQHFIANVSTIDVEPEEISKVNGRIYLLLKVGRAKETR